MRVGEELRGSSDSLSRAAKRSSPGGARSAAIALSRVRRVLNFLARRFRLLLRSIMLVFAIHFLLSRLRPLAAKRKIQACQQRARLVVGGRRRADDDVHAEHILDLVIFDLGEDDVLFQPKRIISSAIEAFRVQPTE